MQCWYFYLQQSPLKKIRSLILIGTGTFVSLSGKINERVVGAIGLCYKFVFNIIRVRNFLIGGFMKINRKSWHYRMLLKSRGHEVWMPKTLCPYFWAVTGKIVGYIGAVILIIALVGVLYGFPTMWFLGFKNDGTAFFVLISLILHFIGLLGFLNFLWIEHGRFYYWKKRPIIKQTIKKAIPEIRTPNQIKETYTLLRDSLKAFKEKVCPFIEYSGEIKE